MVVPYHQKKRKLVMEKNGFVFQPLSPKRNSEEIALQIKESIITKQYEPNERFPSERELAGQFNAGRGAVREALRILEGSGFIYVKPGRDGGIFVKEFDTSKMTRTLIDLVRLGNISIREITETRRIIETSIIESCIGSLRQKDLLALEKNIKNCEELIQEEKLLGGEIQNFHRLIASYSKNQLLIYFLNAIVDISDSYVMNKLPGLPLSPSHLDHHRAILDALKKRNLEEAKKAIIIHLNSVDKHLKKYHRKYHSESK